MKKRILYFLMVILLLSVGSDFVFSQHIIQNEAKETVVLVTDRSIYISGEQVHFSATVFEFENNDISLKSQILYCELIMPDGNKLSGNKYKIIQSLAAGCLDIPEDVITGTYYIRAYTKQMRNNGPDSYAYRQIRIVNPGRNEVLAADKKENKNGEQLIQASKEPLTDILSVSVEKAVYTFRDSVRLSILATNEALSKIKSLSLTVVPEITTSSTMLVPVTSSQHPNKTDYYAETRGLSLSGKLTEATSRNPVKGKRINLSIIGEGRDFMAIRTDSSGRFFFALPDYTGSRDLFLCAEKTHSADLKIWIDNDFCAIPINLPSPVFVLTDLERQTVQNMALNIQVNSFFHSDTLGEISDIVDTEHAFYGKPTTVLYLDQFIQLPTLEEYFNELPGLVKVRKRSGEKYFKVIGSQDLSFYYPLVMVDWVAVDETEKILAVSPQNISRIEIVNQAYIKGGQTYGGIISIISKKGDFAGIDLPSTGIFVNYRFLAENHCDEADFQYPTKYPDARNTVVWKPGISLQSNMEKFVFTAPETPGRYSIVLEGTTFKGERFSKTGVFEVKK